MSPLKPVAAAAVLLLLGPACGGGAKQAAPAAPHATAFTYANPALGGYSLQATAASNGTSHLVLNLMGPAGAAARGVSLFLTADPALATWSKGSGTPPYVTPGTVFQLGASPQAFVTALSATGDLQAGLYQKGGAATFASAPILSVALDLAGTTLTPGTAVTLAATPGTQSVYVDANNALQPLAIAVGTLTLK